MRTLLVLLFIGAVGAGAIYAARRPTIARGDVIGDLLVAANRAMVRGMHCDDAPIGVDGAHFWCTAIYRNGDRQKLEFAMDRAGQIHQVGANQSQHVKRTSDPWGD